MVVFVAIYILGVIGFLVCSHMDGFGLGPAVVIAIFWPILLVLSLMAMMLEVLPW